MALTATATERVRLDIVKQLRLREPKRYVASFNRPNLTYRVLPKSKAYEQVLYFVNTRPNESGIVYCQSRKSAESVVAVWVTTRLALSLIMPASTRKSAQRIRNFSCATKCA